VTVRILPKQLADIDAWIAAQPTPRPSRPEALRRLAALFIAQQQAPTGGALSRVDPAHCDPGAASW
jgi:hypothetical protein